MSWKQWTAVVVVIGLGIVLQIPSHDGAMVQQEPSERTAAPAAASDASEAPYRTITLDVTGMT